MDYEKAWEKLYDWLCDDIGLSKKIYVYEITEKMSDMEELIIN
jgi:hypothetical protein